MEQTVIGIFDNASEAQTAKEKLLNFGFSESKVDISSQSTTSTESTTSRDRDRDDDTDSIGDFFRSLFGSGHEADRHSEVAKRGGTVVTVHAQSEQEAERATDILDQYGAVDVDDRAMDYHDTDNTNLGYTDDELRDKESYRDRDVDVDADNKINVIEEDLKVGKREVETGGVRVRSRIVTRPVEEHLRLREEHVHVERQTVNRPATEADLANFKEGDVEMTEHAEVPVVSKEARVVEEITLNKDVEEREETVREDVRKTEVDVDETRGEAGRDRDVLDRDRDADALDRDGDADALDTDRDVLDRDRDDNYAENRDIDVDIEDDRDIEIKEDRDRDLDTDRDSDTDPDLNRDRDRI